MQNFSLTFKASGPQPTDARSIFNVAQGFYFAGNRAALNIEIGPNTTQSLVSPSVVNYCFALELFFKALIQNDGSKPPKTHKLQELFELLPEGARENLQNEFEDTIRQPMFINFINEISEYFQKVRYEYEYPIEIFYDGPIAYFSKVTYVYSANILNVSPGTSGLVI